MNSPVILRESTPQDRSAFFDWYHTPIRSSLTKQPPLGHSATLHNQLHHSLTLANSTSRIWIVTVDIIRVGAVRLDRREAGTWDALIVLKPPYWGKGLPPKIFTAAFERLKIEDGFRSISLVTRKAGPVMLREFERADCTVESQDSDTLLISRRVDRL